MAIKGGKVALEYGTIHGVSIGKCKDIQGSTNEGMFDCCMPAKSLRGANQSHVRWREPQGEFLPVQTDRSSYTTLSI